jgi:hypothetical protein
MDTNTTNPGLAPSNQAGLIYSGDYQIKALTIITSDGQVVDIKNNYVELNIYEDLFGACMTGTVLMGDALDLIANFKIHGNEWLQIDIDKPTLDKPIQKVFRVYKVSNREFKTASLQNYILHFCSEELVLSSQRFLSKSYKGMIISDMVKDVMLNQLGVSGPKSSTGLWDKTTGLFNIIIPRMNPLEAIQWLSTRAYSSDGTLFMFFENRDGFNFVAYETLLKIPIYQKYFKTPKLSTSAQDNINSVNFLRIIQDFDILASGRYGAFGSSLLSYDFVNRKFSGTTFDPNNFTLLNDNLPINSTKNRFNVPLLGNSDYLLKFYPTSDSDPKINGSHPENWLQKKAMKLAQLFQFKMVISIPGDILMKVGRIVDVELPKAVPQNSAGNQVSETRSGSYLVSAVHHIFINDTSTTVMELLSDSVSGTLNAPLDNSPTMKAVKQR